MLLGTKVIFHGMTMQILQCFGKSMRNSGQLRMKWMLLFATFKITIMLQNIFGNMENCVGPELHLSEQDRNT